MLKYNDENSVWNPATNSLSASGKSNGTRLHSTNIHTFITTNRKYCKVSNEVIESMKLDIIEHKKKGWKQI